MIRKIRVARCLINDFFRNGDHARFNLSNGVPDGLDLFKIDLEEDAAVFWFGPREEVHSIDDSVPIIETFPETDSGGKER